MFAMRSITAGCVSVQSTALARVAKTYCLAGKAKALYQTNCTALLSHLGFLFTY